jgi:hypothetical protein
MKPADTLALLILAIPLPALAHGHPAGIDDNDPIAADVRLCNDVVDAALQALTDRDKGRAMKTYTGDGLRDRLQNEVAQHVFAEPQIRSQKFAMGYARSRCNEALRAERDKGARP